MHQRQMIAFALSMASEELITVANFSEMGTQKTQATINSVDILLDERKIKTPHNILIICPLSVIWSWKDELRDVKDKAQIYILHGTKQQRLNKLYDGLESRWSQRWFLINYEGLHSILPQLLQVGWSAVVADESIKVKRKRSRMTIDTSEIFHRARIRFIMSGKPITLNPLDLFGHFWTLKPSLFGRYFSRFKRRYCVSTWTGQYEKILAWQNLDELVAKIYPYTIRYLKDDCLELPPKVYLKRYCQLSVAEKKAYETLKATSVLDITSKMTTEGAVHINYMITKLMKLNQLAQGFVITDSIGIDEQGKAVNIVEEPSKIKLLKELLEDELTDGQVVIWCNFRQDIRNVCKFLDKLNISNHAFYGATMHRDRETILQKFKQGTTRILVAQPKAGGMGLNLTAARHAIFYSNSFDYGDRAQAEDRLHRPGQKYSVNIIDLISRDTIETKIHHSLKLKRNFSDLIDVTDPLTIFN